MRDNKQIIKYLSSNKDRFEREYHLTKLGVFGSFARNEFSSNSDIDIIVEFAENVDDLYSIKNKIKEEISLKFNRQVDICREKYIKPVFKEQIMSEAIYV